MNIRPLLMQLTNHLKSSIWLILILITIGNSQAQSNQQQRVKTEKLFTGLWINKQSTRHLEISFNDGYATIIDWTSKFQKRESGDIYKATLKNGKLIMPEDTQHRAPYSEILYKNNYLFYLIKPFGTATTSRWDKQVFARVVPEIQ